MSSYTITKDFAFSASHRLSRLPFDHPCSRLHGHNYVVRVALTSESLDAAGMVVDYAALDPFGEYLAAAYDHHHLNDIMPVQAPDGRINPTAERLAGLLLEQVGKLCDLPAGVAVAVGVSETPKTWAWVI